MKAARLPSDLNRQLQIARSAEAERTSILPAQAALAAVVGEFIRTVLS